MDLQQIDAYIENKIAEDEKYVIFTFYELRIKLNLSNDESNTFIKLASVKLENNNYKVYRSGQEYNYNGKKKVEDNQLLIAIKRES